MDKNARVHTKRWLRTDHETIDTRLPAATDPRNINIKYSHRTLN